MPKNKGKGGKNRRRGTKENDDQRRELTFKEDGQEYAQVIKMLGNGRLEALCFDGTKRLANSYGELPETAKINETDSFGQGEDGEAYFEFGDADSDEESDAEVGGKKEVDIDDI
ncbi:eukaryotic translation initiation factor eIF-1A [Fusarium albosuccineum]|uniref:Eukaryotic translation initiation factor eIF-1A n=1 Tax=Fusarium albosuccineum TaxID=1237068 RepID=A0A8H4LPG3_9HYPO|nr:eukaryotic translation initiation factor eIF-1A [Fusarium albosuccineum]